MTLYNTVDSIKTILQNIPNAGTILVDDVYALNSIKDIKYPAYVITQQQHIENAQDDTISYRFYVFYVDRLKSDESNRLDVQSHGMRSLRKLAKKMDDIGYTVAQNTYNTFKERFEDVCAGAFMDMTVEIDETDCGDYEINVVDGGRIKELEEQIAYLTVQNNILQNTVQTLQSTVAEQEVEIEEKTAEIVQKDAIITQKNTQIQTLQSTVVQKDAQIATLNTTITEKDAQISTLNSTIIEKDAIITQKNNRIAELQADLANAKTINYIGFTTTSGSVIPSFKVPYGCKYLGIASDGEGNYAIIIQGKITRLDDMFTGCSTLKTVDLSRCDVSNLERMVSTFRDCSNLETVDMSSKVFTNLKYTAWTFYNDKNLQTVKLGSYSPLVLTGMFQNTNIDLLDLSKMSTEDVAEGEYNDMYTSSRITTLKYCGYNYTLNNLPQSYTRNIDVCQ